MKKNLHVPKTSATAIIAVILVFLFSLAAIPLKAATSIWSGGADNARWLTPGNWDTLPVTNSILRFTTVNQTVNTNTFDAGTPFSGIAFQTPAGAFELWGNAIALSGGITNNQVVTAQEINLPLQLAANVTVDAVANASLTLNREVSGAYGLTKVGQGSLSLAVSNSFTGVLTIAGGTVTANADERLGVAPGTPTAGALIINGGILRNTSDYTINANRGIAVGPTSGSGQGTFLATSGDDLVYGGVIANNGGGTGSVGKAGFGTIRLFGANTYSGDTVISNGLMSLDFTQPTSPVNGIIASTSGLVLGGDNAGAGAESWAGLTILGNAAAATTQTFDGTHVTFSPTRIVATNGESSLTTTLNLGALTHDAGGAVVFAMGTNGVIKTTTDNDASGILGGWALIGDGSIQRGMLQPFWLASVNANDEIVPFTNYVYLTDGGETIRDLSATPNANVFLGAETTGGTYYVDASNAGTTTDINSFTTGRGNGGYSINIGTNNTLRLGKYGFFMRTNAVSTIIWSIGAGVTGGGSGVQGQSTVTAGGPGAGDGELLFHLGANSQSGGSLNFEANITDNPSGGAVTVVKMGMSSMKLRGRNTYSGGTYVLQGRFQAAGNEIGDYNPDAYGSGPVYCFPGTYLLSGGLGSLYPGGTNVFYIAGTGTGQEPLGIFRGGTFSGPVHLMGDANIGGNTVLFSKIDGPYALTLGSAYTITGGATLFNDQNDWTGDTTLRARLNGGATSSLNNITSSNHNVIPNGFGYGNVIMVGASGARVEWNHRGFDDTINGLQCTANGSRVTIQNNNTGSTSTLTVGDNDQTTTFDGTIRNNQGVLNITKIGKGVLTLTRSNYFGNTVISNGVIALVNNGWLGGLSGFSISVYGDGVFDVSSGSMPMDYSTPETINLVGGGTLKGNSVTNAGAIAALNMENGYVTVVLDAAQTNIFAGTVTFSGTNRVNISGVINHSGYPTNFGVIKANTSMTATTADQWEVGAVPSVVTGGYFDTTTDPTCILLVLTNGPQTLRWVGTDATNPSYWDDNTTTNWIGFTGPTAFNQSDTVLFDDTAVSTTIEVRDIPTANMNPSTMVFSNATKNLTFIGDGGIGGFGGLRKENGGSVTFANAGGSGYSDGVTVNAGQVVFATDHSISGGTRIASGATVQVGTNGGMGSLPTGAVVNDGTLVFNRGANLEVSGVISGIDTSAIIKNDASELELSGANTFTGKVTIANGILRAGHASALGRTNGWTVVLGSGALNVDGFNLGGEVIQVGGVGYNGLGTIVNNSGDPDYANPNVSRVVMTNDTTFGGTGRWDLRGAVSSDNTLASLETDGPLNLTKVGTNEVSLVGVTVDPELANIDVQAGGFSVQAYTTGLGNPTNTLTVAAGASLNLWNCQYTLDKVFVLNGTGTNVTLESEAGQNSISGPVTLGGTNIFQIAGTYLKFDNSVSNSAGACLIKTGGSRLIFSDLQTVTYTGWTAISNGAVQVDATKTGGAGITVHSNATLAGSGSITENVTVAGGAISPGGITGIGTVRDELTINGNVAMVDSAISMFELADDPVSVDNDKLVINGALSLTGSNTFHMGIATTLDVGDSYTIISYTPGSGSNVDSNHITITAPEGYGFDLDTSEDGKVKVVVNKSLGNCLWFGFASSIWDNSALNWKRNGFNDQAFVTDDVVTFDDRVGVYHQTIDISGVVSPNSILANNYSFEFTLQGSGGISGGTNGAKMLVRNTVPFIIANTGGNDYEGSVTIWVDPNEVLPWEKAILQVGNGGLGGKLGTGVITNQGVLLFNRAGLPVWGTNWSDVDRSACLVVSNIITGTGVITNMGPGVVFMAGASTFTGDFYVTTGTVAAASTTAFGATNGTLYIEDGTTLDVNGTSINTKRVFVKGAGVNGQGAVINRTAQATAALRHVTLTGDTTFGGGGEWATYGDGNGQTNRWDIRGSGASDRDAFLLADDPDARYKLTKIGNNQVSLVYCTNVGLSIADIDIKEGAFAMQYCGGIGNPTNTLTVYSNAWFNLWNNDSGYVDKRIVLKNGGGYWADSGQSTNVGPVTLEGYAVFLLDAGDPGAHLTLVSNSISGVGPVMVRGSGTQNSLILAGTNAWTGNTTISNASIELVGEASLTNTPTIQLGYSFQTDGNRTNVYGNIYANERVDQTFAMRAGQTLRGRGSIFGILAPHASGTIAPGLPGELPAGTITVHSNLTLAGAIQMEIDPVTATSDRIQIGASGGGDVTYGGTLTLTALSGAPFLPGQNYRLFAATNYAGSFSPTPTLPTLPYPLSWQNDLATDGSLTVVSAAVSPAVINSVTTANGTNVIAGVSGDALNLAGPFMILSSTNLTLSLTNWTTVATDSFDGAGAFSVSIPIDTNSPVMFYNVVTPQ